ncbi:alpha/beta hydrolase [Maridesulfovibrio sp.]|uniref:alpha/beta fold hydrolase n=1 Tax=Maridesulfovibrio sp. TaxID=2795000 RepID=UPI0029F519F6|nr:alpha/beta hydrolase [Maridesulfovibrio sp.]
MNIVFVAGWASDPSQYPQFAESARFLVPFSGFKPEQLPALVENGGDVLVGWSTGAHILLKECRHLFGRFERVVLIAPFLSFTDSFPVRLVRGMVQGMENDPAAVVRAFHENCAESEPPLYDQAKHAVLVDGLEFLISSKIEITAKVSVPNLVVVRGRNDRIVRRKAFDKVMTVIEDAQIVEIEGGHKVSEPELVSIIKG